MRERSVRVAGSQPARFITVEGIEGSGKSTLLANLARTLAELGLSIVTTREPGGTSLGDRLRRTFVEPGVAMAPLAEAFVVNASRAQLLAEIVEPALEHGSWVLCDRYVHATYAYQGYGRGLSAATLRTLTEIATRGREADLTFMLDLPVEVSRARVAARATRERVAIDRLEREDVAFHERVRAGYLAIARAETRIVLLDGTRAADELCSAATGIVRATFGV